MTPYKTQIVVGIDAGNEYAPAIGLIQRLEFPEPHLELIHAAPETLPIPFPFANRTEIEARYAEVVSNLGNAALQASTNLACGKGIACDARLVHGNPAERIIEAAAHDKVDLVAINSARCGVVQKSYIGSLARALAIGSPTSVLVTKGAQGVRNTLRAVFATDHSPFAQRCLEQFIRLAPRGIKEIHVVTAWQLDDHQSAILSKNLASLGGDADRWITEELEAMNIADCAMLEAAGYHAVSIVREGKPNEVIHHAMTESRADLLVVGSQGSGAMSRSLVGSVSLHQVTAEFYPVLVIRPREKA